jgi:hypothetical protein
MGTRCYGTPIQIDLLHLEPVRFLCIDAQDVMTLNPVWVKSREQARTKFTLVVPV